MHEEVEVSSVARGEQACTSFACGVIGYSVIGAALTICLLLVAKRVMVAGWRRALRGEDAQERSALTADLTRARAAGVDARLLADISQALLRGEISEADARERIGLAIQVEDALRD